MERVIFLKSSSYLIQSTHHETQKASFKLMYDKFVYFLPCTCGTKASEKQNETKR